MRYRRKQRPWGVTWRCSRSALCRQHLMMLSARVKQMHIVAHNQPPALQAWHASAIPHRRAWHCKALCLHFAAENIISWLLSLVAIITRCKGKRMSAFLLD